MKRSVALKMGVKENSRAFLKNADIEAVAGMELPPLDISMEISGDFDYIHIFTKNQKEFKLHFPVLKSVLKPTGMLWVSWPKGGKLDTDLNIKIRHKIRI